MNMWKRSKNHIPNEVVNLRIYSPKYNHYESLSFISINLRFLSNY